MLHDKLFSGLMIFLWMLSACQSPKNSDIFRPNYTYCNGQLAWSAESNTQDTPNYSTFWIAFAEDTVQDNFKYVNVEVVLDGKSADEEMKFRSGPESYSIMCSEGGQRFEGSRMKYTLFLPSLAKGKHEIVWKFTLTSDLSDGLFDYPNGMTGEVTDVLNVQ